MKEHKPLVQSYMNYLFNSAIRKGEENISRFLERMENSVFVDIGCNDGKFTSQMVKITQAKEIYGIELDDDNAAKASQKGIFVYKNDLNKEFPMASESIDVVVASQVIEHIINVDNFVKETYRILKHGGYAIIATENLASWHNIFCLLLGKQPYSGPYVSTEYSLGQHPVNRDPKKGISMEIAYIKHNTVMAYLTLKELLQVYGFKIVGSKGSGYHPWPGKLSDLFSSLDIKHSHIIVIKARKL